MAADRRWTSSLYSCTRIVVGRAGKSGNWIDRFWVKEGVKEVEEEKKPSGKSGRKDWEKTSNCCWALFVADARVSAAPVVVGVVFHVAWTGA